MKSFRLLDGTWVTARSFTTATKSLARSTQDAVLRTATKIEADPKAFVAGAGLTALVMALVS